MEHEFSADQSASDWGIEETRGIRGAGGFGGTEESISSFIGQHLDMKGVRGEFWDKFKYGLITSTLLDDSMVLSKNEQALSSMEKSSNYRVSAICRQGGSYTMALSGAHFKLRMNHVQSSSIFTIINLIHKCLNGTPWADERTKHTIFKILLVTSVRYIRYYKLKLKIFGHRNLNSLNKFLFENYKMNKKIIHYMLQLKSSKLLQQDGSGYQAEIIHLLENALNLAIFTVRSGVFKLLPYMNGEVLEKYCLINNIRLDLLLENSGSSNSLGSLSTTSDSKMVFDDNKYQHMVQILNMFNQMRKLLICQLLTFDELPSSNFFLSKLKSKFCILNKRQAYLSSAQKQILISSIFDHYTLESSSYMSIFENFDVINKEISMGLETIKSNQDVLNFESNDDEDNVVTVNESNINALVNKVTDLSINLKYFKEYSFSTRHNSDELSEKAMIFNQFDDELKSINELYKISVNTFNNQLFKSSNDGEDLSLYGSDQFDENLRQFHNPSIRKHYSLPSHQMLRKNSVSSPTTSSEPDTSSSKRYSKLSTGLQLGLLTVLEEPKKSSNPDFKREHVSYDDNYINILPPASYETYNQAALDSLQKGGNGGSNGNFNSRFSVNSINSNVSGMSDLVNLTQITSIDENSNVNNSDYLPKNQLVSRLEENYSRLYSQSDSKIGSSRGRFSGDEPMDLNAIKDGDVSSVFINELDKKLDNKINTKYSM